MAVRFSNYSVLDRLDGGVDALGLLELGHQLEMRIAVDPAAHRAFTITAWCHRCGLRVLGNRAEKEMSFLFSETLLVWNKQLLRDAIRHWLSFHWRNCLATPRFNAEAAASPSKLSDLDIELRNAVRRDAVRKKVEQNERDRAHASYELQQRERSSFHVFGETKERVSAEWSRRLREKVTASAAAAKERERVQVVVDYGDDDYAW